jgi:hypothetical protein
LRDRDGRLDRIALRVDDAALAVGLERAVAGIGEGAVGQLDLEKAFVPWLISRGVPTVFTPPPMSTPTGRMVPWSEACAPTRRTWS